MRFDDIQNLLDQGALLLDVRTPAELGDIRIPGAVQVPAYDLEAFVPQLTAMLDRDPTRPIVVVSSEGYRSRGAARYLRSLGFINATNAGGLVVDPIRTAIERQRPFWRRPPPTMRPILWSFYQAAPFPDEGDWNRLAWSIGLPSGGHARQLAYEAEANPTWVPGLGWYPYYSRQAMFAGMRRMIADGRPIGAE